MANAPALYRKLSYNPLTDFEYVSQVIDVPMTLLGRKDLPANNPQPLFGGHAAQGPRRRPFVQRPAAGAARAGAVTLEGLTS